MTIKDVIRKSELLTIRRQVGALANQLIEMGSQALDDDPETAKAALDYAGLLIDAGSAIGNHVRGGTAQARNPLSRTAKAASV